MSDQCEGCASKEAQVVFLANRAAIYSEALQSISDVTRDDEFDRGQMMEYLESVFYKANSTTTGLRVELDGVVLIEP